MTTSEDFVATIAAKVEQLARVYAGSPDEWGEQSLADFGASGLTGSRAVFPFFEKEEVKGMVDDLLGRIRASRREIEAAGVGVA